MRIVVTVETTPSNSEKKKPNHSFLKSRPKSLASLLMVRIWTKPCSPDSQHAEYGNYCQHLVEHILGILPGFFPDVIHRAFWLREDLVPVSLTARESADLLGDLEECLLSVITEYIEVSVFLHCAKYKYPMGIELCNDVAHTGLGPLDPQTGTPGIFRATDLHEVGPGHPA